MRRRIQSSNPHCVGLDLSLRAAAMCALPLDWDHDLTKVRMGKAGYELPEDASPRESIERLAQIAHDVSVFCLNAKAVRIAAESYAFAASSSSVTKLAELGGAVRVDVLETLDIAIETITASRARKIMLQNCPNKGSKKFVIRNLKRLAKSSLKGAERILQWTEDELDAFVVVNALLMYEGGIAMTFEGEW